MLALDDGSHSGSICAEPWAIDTCSRGLAGGLRPRDSRRSYAGRRVCCPEGAEAQGIAARQDQWQSGAVGDARDEGGVPAASGLL